MDSAERSHPAANELVRFMRGELPRSEVRDIVRHLLTGCPRCVQVTKGCWKLGDPPLRLLAADPSDAGEGSERRLPRVEGELGKSTAP